MKTKLSTSFLLLFTGFMLNLSGQKNELVIGLLNGTDASLINLEEAKDFVKTKLTSDAVINNLHIQWVQDEEKYFLLAKVDNAIQSAIALELGRNGEKLYALAGPGIQIDCMSYENCNQCDWQLINISTLICKCSREENGKCNIVRAIKIN